VSGEEWRDLHQAMWDMVIQDLDNNRQLGPFYVMNDLGPQIVVFFDGYMAGYRLWQREIEKFIASKKTASV
jgi:hypothetical protein